MPFYMVKIIGTGADADPYRPDLPEGARFAAVIPSGATGAPRHGWAIVTVDAAPPASANRQAFPEGSLSALTGKQRNDLANAIQTRFGLTVSVATSRTGLDVVRDVLAHLDASAAPEKIR